MTISDTYRLSLKPREVEEWTDLFVYRPLGFLFAVPLVRTPVTPNMVTFASALIGISGGVFLAVNDCEYMVLGAFLYFISNVLDCTDGMMARMTGRFSRFGKIFDGVADYLVGLAVFVGMGIGCDPYPSSPWLWWLLVIAGIVFTSYQGMHLNHVRDKYLRAIGGEGGEHREVTLETLNRTKSRKARFFLLYPFIALHQLYRLLENNLREPVRMPQSLPPRDEIPKTYLFSLRLWTFTGKGTHVTLLTAFLLAGHPEWYCWVVLIPGNLYLFIAWLFHHHALNQIELQMETAG